MRREPPMKTFFTNSSHVINNGSAVNVSQTLVEQHPV